ncbi:CPBP family intramembrane glutamic endopeptidase [Pseudoduganella sp. HUAS MS19]
MSAIAVAIIALLHDKPYLSKLHAGMPLLLQAGIGLTVGLLYWAFGVIGFKYAAARKTNRSTVESYSRLDLSGWNPVWIALAAGFGEELLFRGALQPLLGIWFTSALFVLAHTRAYKFNELTGRVLIQAGSVFVVSVFFGYITQYVGLLAAMVIHAAIDIVGLYAIRRMASQTPAVA